MKFVGAVVMDNGETVTTRGTNPMSFSVMADWFKSVSEYHTSEMRYGDSNYQSVTISVFQWHEVLRNKEFAMPVEQRIIVKEDYPSL